MRIDWLAPYPINLLTPKLTTNVLLNNKEMQMKFNKNAKAAAVKRNLPEKVCKIVMEVYNEILNK